MQINDKIKESNENFVEFGECYCQINSELEKGKKADLLKIRELFDKKTKLWNKRMKILNEIQMLVNKLNEDWQIKFDSLLEQYKQ